MRVSIKPALVAAATAWLSIFAVTQYARAQCDLPFPEGTIINNDDTIVEAEVNDLKNKDGKPLPGQVRFVMKRKNGMWGKRFYIYNTSGKKIVTLELGHNQQGNDMLEAKIDKRAADLKGKLVFSLEHVGGLGPWHENERWEFTGECIAGKEIVVTWVKDKG